MIPMRTAQESRSSSTPQPDPGPAGLRIDGQFVPRARIASATRLANQFGAGAGGADITGSGFTNVYDPIVSRDFLEIPQDLNVRWAWYRHFYRHDPLVNRAIDLHSTLPISRISLRPPKGEDRAKSAYVKDFFEKMLERINLLSHLINVTREYNLVGNFFSYAQDDEDTLAPEEEDPFSDYPEDDFEFEEEEEGGEGGEGKRRRRSAEERLEAKKKWYAARFGKRNPEYSGWDRITILPIENIRIQTFEFDPSVYYEYIPGNTGHPYMNRPYTVQDTRNNLISPLQRTIPSELFDLYERMEQMGQPVDLPSDPYEGSAVWHAKRNAADFDEMGMSALDPILKTLIHKDKLRQLNTLIINRRMTPVRLISGEDLSIRDVEDLRAQIDAALHTPDYSVITNYEVRWEEIGSQDRLLETETKNEALDREIMMGLHLFEGLLTGDSTYGGNRVAVEVMNSEYLQYRETVLERYIEDFILKPVAYKKGFIEIDEFGNEVLLYPTVRFSRLGIRDNDQLYDQMFNLYLQGSLPLAVILDLVNVDIDEAEEGVKEDMLTVRDPKFQDFWSGVLTAMADQIANGTDLGDRLIEYLQVEKKEGGGEEDMAGRFGMASDRKRVSSLIASAGDNTAARRLSEIAGIDDSPIRKLSSGAARMARARANSWKNRKKANLKAVASQTTGND